jgi:hypothetical protein
MYKKALEETISIHRVLIGEPGRLRGSCCQAFRETGKNRLWKWSISHSLWELLKGTWREGSFTEDSESCVKNALEVEPLSPCRCF